jgi:hypothetical protein
MKPMCDEEEVQQLVAIRTHDAQLLFSPPPPINVGKLAPLYSTLIAI